MDKKKLANPWLMWGMMAAAFLLVYFHRYSTTVIGDALSSELGITQEQLATISSIYFYSYGLLQIPMGMLIDWMGARKVASAGMLSSAAGTFIFAAATGWPALYLGRFLIGVGASTALVATLKVQTDWFTSAQFPLLSSLVVTIGNIGALVATTPMAWLSEMIGWRQSCQLIGAITLLVSLGIALFVRPKQSFDKKNSFSAREMLCGLSTVLKTSSIWPPTICLICFYSTTLSFNALWGIPYIAGTFCLDAGSASTFLLVVNLGLILGAPVMGSIISHGTSMRWLLCGFGVVSVLSWGILLLSFRIAVGMACTYLAFFAIGVCTSAALQAFTCAKSCAPSQYAGIAYSFVNTVPIFATAIVNTATTALAGVSAGSASYVYPVWLFFVLSIIGVLVASKVK